MLAHQNVSKLNANDYTTSMSGLKFKIAYKRADTGKWSATPQTQRKRMITFLRDVIEDLEKEQEEVTATPAQLGATRRTPRRGQRMRPPAVVKRPESRLIVATKKGRPKSAFLKNCRRQDAYC